MCPHVFLQALHSQLSCSLCIRFPFRFSQKLTKICLWFCVVPTPPPHIHCLLIFLSLSLSITIQQLTESIAERPKTTHWMELWVSYGSVGRRIEGFVGNRNSKGKPTVSTNLYTWQFSHTKSSVQVRWHYGSSFCVPIFFQFLHLPNSSIRLP